MANQSANYLDGSPLNATYDNLLALVPTQDSLREFKVATNNISPEYGKLAGGAIDFTTKSGTNDLHGSLWEFLRNKVFQCQSTFLAIVQDSLTRHSRRTSMASTLEVPSLSPTSTTAETKHSFSWIGKDLDYGRDRHSPRRFRQLPNTGGDVSHFRCSNL